MMTLTFLVTLVRAHKLLGTLLILCFRVLDPRLACATQQLGSCQVRDPVHLYGYGQDILGIN